MKHLYRQMSQKIAAMSLAGKFPDAPTRVAPMLSVWVLYGVLEYY